MASRIEFIKKFHSEIAFIAILFLLFLQLFSDFLESIYLLVLMTLSINENLLSILFLFSPILLIAFNKRSSDKLMLITGFLMIVCRVIEPLFETTTRMIISGLGVGCFLILFPMLLTKKDLKEEEQWGLTLGLGLTVAIAASVLLRTLNLTIDLSTHGWGQVIGWGLAVIELILLVGFLRLESSIETSPTSDSITSHQPTGLKQVIGISLGLASIIFFITFAFSSPVVISRWTEGNYILITSLVVLMLTLFAYILLNKPEIITNLKPQLIFFWNLLFFLSFVLTIFMHQIPFPNTPESYPIEAPMTTYLHQIPLIVMLITYPIILIDFMLLTKEILKLEVKPKASTMGVSFTIGFGLYMMLMIFSIVFTSVWGFIPVIGVIFRDMFWLVFLIVGVVVVLSLFNVSEKKLSFQNTRMKPKAKTVITGVMVILFLGTIVSAIAFEAHPMAPAGDATSLRILTYNLQQGVSNEQNKNYDGQLELIRDVDADIIGLQESSKIAGSSDVVMYFANRLNLYSYFGPKGVTGTTGVALLSKYPIENPRTYYHYCENVDRKQTATIEAEITVGSKTFTVYVTHTYGRTSAKSILQTDVLNLASGKSDVIFMGDFNFRPNSEPYNLTTAVLDDSWWLKWPTGTNSQGENNSRDVDHVFVSPGTTVTDCQYIWDPQSDHPAYWADIQWSVPLSWERSESDSSILSFVLWQSKDRFN